MIAVHADACIYVYIYMFFYFYTLIFQFHIWNQDPGSKHIQNWKTRVYIDIQSAKVLGGQKKQQKMDAISSMALNVLPLRFPKNFSTARETNM